MTKNISLRENRNKNLFGHLFRKNALMYLIGLLVGIDFFESTMFVFASNHIMGGIGAGPREFSLCVASYAIGSMLMIIIQHWSTSHFGYRNYLIFSILIFTGGTLFCALSENTNEFILARLFQGFGCGAFFTSSRVLVNVLFARKDRPKALMIFVSFILCATLFSPIVASYCIDRIGWEWVFYSALPLSLVSLFLCIFYMPKKANSFSPEYYPVLSFITFAIGIILFQIVFAEARYDFFSDPIKLIIPATIGLVIIAVFFWLQYNHHSPIIPLKNLHHPVYFSGILLYFVFYFLLNFSSYLFPVFAEQGLSIPVVAVGWLNTISGISGLIVGWLYIKYLVKSPKKKIFVIIGILALSVTALIYSRLSPDTNVAMLIPGLILNGIFANLMISPVSMFTFKEFNDDDDFSHAYQSKNIVRQMAGSLSIAIASVVYNDRTFAVTSGLSENLNSTNNSLNQLLKNLSVNGHTDTAIAIADSLINKQAQFIASQDLYILLLFFTFIGVIIAALQKKLV